MASRPAPHGARPWVLLVPLLLSTFTSTVASTVVIVPLALIMADLEVPISQGILIVVVFNLTFAVLMPVAGWFGDTFGRRRLICFALCVLAVGTAASALAPNLEMLVAFRAVQGLGTACLLPNVMSLIATTFAPASRSRALGAWAAVNGAGQSAGPALGAVLAGWAGWRAAFWPIVPVALLACVGVWRLVPADRPRPGRLEWHGALLLTTAAFLCLGAITAIPPLGLKSPVVLASGVVGTALLVAFLMHQHGRADAFLPLWILSEPRYVRSCVAVMAQMFCLGATLVGMPLYLVLELGTTTVVAGAVVLSLPITMLLLAPVAGLIEDRYGLWRTLRLGLLLLIAGQCALAGLLADRSPVSVGIVLSLVLLGGGVALVQTLAATGATGSSAGKVGAAIGLYNLLRFGAAAVGAAWPAVALGAAPRYGLIYLLCAIVGGIGLLGTYLPARHDSEAPQV